MDGLLKWSFQLDIIPVAPSGQCKEFVYLLLLLWKIIWEWYARYLDKDWGWLQGTAGKKYRMRSDDAT